MAFNFSDFHSRHRTGIIAEWVRRLSTQGGPQYIKRPQDELFGTVSEAFDANRKMIVDGDYTHINRFIDKITKMRLEAGFPLSDVQNAFELYRRIVIPLLAKEAGINESLENVSTINECLAYTIQRFSKHFQGMHEREILEHNRLLEEEVKARTSQLRESELKYKTLVEEIKDGYFVIRDEVIVFANKAFCQMHGFVQEEVLGRKFQQFVCPEDRDRVVGIYEKSFTTRASSRSFEYQRLTKSGERFPTEILARNATYENKPSSIGICRDITDRVKMEQRMREAERMAYIGEITTSLSHEIRNPLAAIKMNLKLLNNNPTIRGNDSRRLAISVNEVNRLENILNELLDFAKPLQIKLGEVDINTILLSSIELLEMKFREKNIKITKKLTSKIPELRADAEKLEQAFINLLLNAVEASESNGDIVIRTAYRRNGGNKAAEITFEDKGYGLKDSTTTDLFKPFFTTKSRGTGLGLSNVKKIVEAHNGWVEVKNRRPRGASFKIYLPGGDQNVQNTGR
jgi:PAS domain S-box-containing protein